MTVQDSFRKGRGQMAHKHSLLESPRNQLEKSDNSIRGAGWQLKSSIKVKPYEAELETNSEFVPEGLIGRSGELSSQ